ncbi:hypothetical protein HYFRA_00000357 [Hymenoscyphus fraxineus]|uniref:Carrier domain-containing protein n=1 Tax=Hymenoscyphus fraxineus TaxID=746836 RepID=A0A9N9L2P8_9HELO|nr:hypothetical protein HYFRA_00000357 [Hymenoscyphus fraxineus]
MAENAMPETLRLELLDIEPQVDSNTVKHNDRPYIHVLIAWVILSATYSADDEASIDFLGHGQERDVLHLRFHLDDEQTIEELYKRVQEELTDVVRQSEDSETPNGGIPKALITTSLDSEVYKFLNGSTYDLAIAPGFIAREDGKNVLRLKVCSKSSLPKSELDLILTRLDNLITQIHGSIHEKIQKLDSLIASDKTNIAALNEGMPPAEHIFAHELVAQQARITPNNEAVCAWDGSLTYEELDQKAVSVANYLVQCGVTVGSWVPLLFEKSKWHIVSMLAVLKTGAAFVALDVTMPVGRIANILKQLDNIPLALASASQCQKFQGIVDSVVVFKENLTIIERSSDLLPATGVEGGIQSDQPAYVIFTSGSTGIPKGAVIEHSNLTTSIRALNAEINATSDMRSFQVTMLNLDFCISEIFCPLFCGGCVCIPSEWSRFNDIPGAVDSLNANFMSLSPTLLSTMAIADFPKLKSVLLAGERVWKDLTDLWMEAGKRVLHMYGPTECTVGCCFLDPDVKPHYTGLIGNPYASKFWIVHPQNSDKLQPIGAPGEILIEGPTVGRCYLGDEKKTKEIFIPPPAWFSSICQRDPVRFYKTGDLGRLTRAGDYEIVGRKDSQVKIRGWRIEILEIEHQIRLASGLGTAVEVRNPTSIPGQEQLVAFLEFQKHRDHEGTTADVDVLWEKLASDETEFSKMIVQMETKLREVLPDYMIPAAFIPIRTFPMTNIFKLNRRKLKETANALDLSSIRSSRHGTREDQADRPLSEDEKKLLEIFNEALHLPMNTIGVVDDFFRAGGDSLKAMAVVAAARRNGMNISVAKLYQFRNVQALAQNIGEEDFDGVQDEPFSLLDGSIAAQILEVAAEQCQIASRMIEDIMPLTDMQKWYIEHNQMRQFRCWISTASFELPADVGVEQIQSLWEQLMARHPITRTRFVNTPFGVFQVVLKSESVIWEKSSDVATLLEVLEGDIRGLGFPSHASGLLINRDQKPSHLIWYASHALLDQLMLELLSEELNVLYKSGSSGLRSRPPFKRIIQHRNASDKSESHKFWQSHFKSANFKALFKENQTIDSLADRRLSNETELTIPEWLKVSEYTVSMTALALALAKITGNEDIAFMLARTGRVGGMVGSENVAGPLITRAPLRISVKRDQSITDLLRSADSDFLESGKHEIVDVKDFLSSSPEAAAHLKHALWVNFRPPTGGLTLGRDNLFTLNSDFRDGMAERDQIISIFGQIYQGKLKMDVIWENKSIPHGASEKLLEGWQTMVQVLGRSEPSLTVGKVLDG